MASPLSISNTSLSMLGAARISAFDITDSPQAALCVEFYQDCVDGLLSEWDWRFAVETRQLDRVAEALPEGLDWAYWYAIPTNCLRFIETDDKGEPRYEIVASPTGNEGGQLRLVSDDDEVWADMVIRKEAALFPAHFLAALHLRFAAMLAMPITRRVDFAQEFERKALSAVAQAKAIDFNQRPQKPLRGGRQIADARLSN